MVSVCAHCDGRQVQTGTPTDRPEHSAMTQVHRGLAAKTIGRGVDLLVVVAGTTRCETGEMITDHEPDRSLLHLLSSAYIPHLNQRSCC